jgi:NAD(P)-dependent dehydrogenase (short-subunit alcohol dehydrogenase family)
MERDGEVGGGIGKATAISAAVVGLRIAAWDLNHDGAEATAGEIWDMGGDALALGADVTDDGQVQAALDASEAGLGAARYLVNNAGPASAADIPFERGVLAGVGSVRRVTEAWLVRALPAEPALVNVSSVAGNLIGTAPDWYPATKAAIMGYTRHLATCSRDQVRGERGRPWHDGHAAAGRLHRQRDRAAGPAADPGRTAGPAGRDRVGHPVPAQPARVLHQRRAARG